MPDDLTRYRAECNSPMHDRIGYSDDIQDCMVQHSDWVGLVPDDSLQQIADAHQKYLDARKANDHVHAQRTWLDREALLDGLVNDE